MRLGFTGTRGEITPEQRGTLCAVLSLVGQRPDEQNEFHHGDCVGADAAAVQMVRDMSNTHPRIVVSHPPINTRYRAYTVADVEYPPEEYLPRNRRIVDTTELLIAVPSGPETLRSGTWSTVRYAVKHGKTVLVIYPDGQVDVIKGSFALGSVINW